MLNFELWSLKKNKFQQIHDNKIRETSIKKWYI